MSTPLNKAVNPSNALNWPGASGATYQLYNYPIGSAFKAEPGVYIFCRPVKGGW